MKKIPFIFLLVLLMLLSTCGSQKSVDPGLIEDEPIIMEKLSWPKSEIATLIPVPNSTVGKIDWEDSYGFVIDVGETSVDEYNSYVEDCWEAGFNIDYRKGEDFFWADNTNGYSVSVRYEGDNVMWIRLDAPSEGEPIVDENSGDNSDATQTEPIPETSLEDDVDRKTTFSEIYKEFKRNELTAKETYNGNRYVITAKINGMETGGLFNLTGGATLTMELKVENTIVFFYAEFEKKQEEKLKQVSVGDTITFVGTCYGGNFSECEIEV